MSERTNEEWPQRRDVENKLRDAVTKACADTAWLSYRDPVWQRIAKAFQWNQVWPVVDCDGDLTGEVSEMRDGLLTTTDWNALISVESARQGGWFIDREQLLAAPPQWGESEEPDNEEEDVSLPG